MSTMRELCNLITFNNLW